MADSNGQEGECIDDLEMVSLPVNPTAWHHGVSRFEDGVRTVDYVIAWNDSIPQSSQESASEKRKIFENNLRSEGLELEYDVVSTLRFVKIHVPWPVLLSYAETMKFRQPIKKELCDNFPCDDNKSIINKHMVYDEGQIIKEFDSEELNICLQCGDRSNNKAHQEERRKSRTKTYVKLLGRHKNSFQKFLYQNVYVDSTYFPPVGFRYSTTFSKDKLYLFDLDEENFFTPTCRSRVAHHILDRTIFESQATGDVHAFGINRLINSRVYEAAYPPHDGSYESNDTLRHALLHEWGSFNRLFRYQPLDYIKDYFGIKVALYFCWLGFYTCMLFPAAVIGVIVFLSGFFHVDSSALSTEVCDKGENILMCPLCDKFCDFWKLNISCTYSTILSFFDNGGTAFFAAFMSIWAVLFLELWKRYSAEVTHRWDLTTYDILEESPRPQYLARVERYYTMKKNKVTGLHEKRVPYWTVKLPATFFSFSVVALLVLLALVACVGVIVYRMAMITASALYGKDGLGDLSSHTLVLINITAGILNLIALMFLTWLYDWVAVVLTEFEMSRTQTEFDDSLTFKMYLLQFINYYTSIFYLAFVKGKYVGYPGNYIRVFRIRQEECDTGGCLFEVTAQLAIIMVGKQIVSTFMELIYPVVMKYWRGGFKKRHWKGKPTESGPQWLQDYFLEEIDIFNEYLEMVLQFGFVTIFVSAFPLAPLCALLNNLVETRCDAQKMLKYYRRPVSVRVKNIGVWLTILDFVSKFAVFSNALIISFTSEFIPHLVYRLTESPDWSLKGYMNYSLSYMDVQYLDNIGSNFTSSDLKYCRYKDYRYPPWHEYKYEHTTTYWTVLAARLIFMVLFENIVVFMVLLLSWAIPDIPVKLKEKIRREAYILNNIIVGQARSSTKRMNGDSKDDDHKKPPQEGGHNSKADNGYTSDLSADQVEITTKLNDSGEKNFNTKWNKDFTVRPHDEALVHRPSNYGEIIEETL